MILCQCHRVSERAIRRAIHGGARSVEEIGAACQAGTSCGSCRPSLEELLAEAEVWVPVGVAGAFAGR
ncbi:MAG: (2Fe-2S)-binding protein [Ilumatobacteraceae bacterium]|nr:MAG: (2Fe-2S)-binding protein [Actinomycetota bacterium]